MNKLLVSTAFILAGSAMPASAALASGKPTTLSVTCKPVTEGGAASCSIAKSGGNGRAITVSWITANGTAKAPGDYAARSGVNSLGGVPITVTAPTVDDSLVNGTRTFSVIASYGTVKASGTVTVLDNDVAPPAPMPPPPAPTPGWLPSPSVSGLPSIPSNFDIALGMQASSWATPSSAPDVVGAFRFICAAGAVKPDDPIVYPGQPGASHLHQFYGNTSIDAYSTYQSLREKGGSTCNVFGDGTLALNRSGYWMPALLTGTGYVVRPDYVIIYYKRRPASDPVVSDPANPKYEGKAVPLPNGLRYIYGFNMLKPSDPPTGEAWFNCQGPSAVPGHYPNLTQALANCPAGNQLGAVLEAPECWDGKNLDSPDHRSHVSYPSYGSWGYRKCPDGFPYVIPTFTLGAWYSIVAGDDTSKWSLASDAMFPNLPKGSTLHADWFGAWDDTTLAMWTDNCINKMLNCSAGLMGNGKVLTGAAYTGKANPRLVPVP